MSKQASELDDDSAGWTVDGSVQAPPPRSQTTYRANAIVVVDSGDGSHEVRLLDFLRAHADDTETFERVGALSVGQTIQISAGTRVRRIA